jgi:hypothetical protein
VSSQGPVEKTVQQTSQETVALASAALGHPLVGPVDLGGSRRSRVLRCTAGDRTVVVKRFLDGGDGFVREAVGLSTLDRTPTLLAQDAKHRLLVMSDVGELPTLADLLLAGDREAAWAGARSWAFALGDLAGRSKVDVARQRLRAAGVEPWDATATCEAASRGCGRSRHASAP